jgi:hypothetical protein
MNAELAETMRRARGLGCSVIPVGAGKKAAVGWRAYMDRLPTEAELDQWEAMDVDGIAVVCGRISKGLMCLDVEKAGVDRGIRPRDGGYVQATAGGGFHEFAFVEDCDDSSPVLARSVSADGEEKLLAEVRGNSHYALLAPSNGRTHPNGGAWVVLIGSLESIPTLTAEEWQERCNEVRAFNESPPRPEHNPQTDRAAIPSENDRPGDAYMRATSWTEVLVGARLLRTADGIGYWNRPGAKTDGTDATTNANGTDRLHMHSTSWRPFEANESYDKFGAYALLHHGGDLRAAAQALKPQKPAQPVSNLLVPKAELAVPQETSMPAPNVDYSRPWREGHHEPGPFIVRGWFEAATVSAVFGDSDVGKSWAMLTLACCVATGTPWLGLEVREPLTVVYFAAEGRSHAARRIAGIAERLELDVDLLDQHLFLVDPPSDAPWPIPVDALAESVRGRGAALLIIDTLSAAAWLEEESSNAEAAVLIAGLTRIADEFGTHVSFVHHSGKDAAKGQRGASALRANVRAEFQLERRDGGLVLACTKLNNAPRPDPIDVRLDVFALADPPRAWGVPSTSAVMVRDSGRRSDPLTDLLDVLRGAGRPMKRAALLEACEELGTPDQVDRLVARGRKLGLISKVGRGVIELVGPQIEELL